MTLLTLASFVSSISEEMYVFIDTVSHALNGKWYEGLEKEEETWQDSSSVISRLGQL